MVMGQEHVNLIRNPKAPDMKLALVQVFLCKHHLTELTGLIVDHVEPYTVSLFRDKNNYKIFLLPPEAVIPLSTISTALPSSILIPPRERLSRIM